MRFAGSATFSAFVAHYLAINNGTDAIAIAQRVTTPTTSVSQTGATDMFVRVSGRMVCSGSGAFTMQGAQQAANGTTTFKNGVLKIWEI